MNTIYFVLMLGGVAWLAVWSVLPADRRIDGWWPFDMLEPDAPQPEPDAPPRRPGATPRWRQAKHGTGRPWR